MLEEDTFYKVLSKIPQLPPHRHHTYTHARAHASAHISLQHFLKEEKFIQSFSDAEVSHVRVNLSRISLLDVAKCVQSCTFIWAQHGDAFTMKLIFKLVNKFRL